MISGNSWLTPDELRPATLVDLLKLRALSTPSRIALIELADGELESGRITFAELDSRARNVAAALSAEGLSGERVLLAFPSGIDYVVALWGCLYAGAIAVPAYPPTSSAHGERLHQVMDDCAAKLILVPDSLLNKARQRLGRLTDMPRIEALSTFQASAEFTPPDINPESIAYLQYTSGSTSNPKGVMVSHRNVLAHASGVRAALQHDQNDVTVTWAPLFHDLGLVMGVFHPIFLGGLIVMMPPVAFQQKPVRWLQAISRYRATTSLAPNFAYQLCVDAIPDLPANELDLGCWRVAINGAEPVRESTLVAFARRFNRYGFDSRAYRPGYGMAESTLAVAVANGAWEDDSSVLEVDPERLELHQLVPISSGGVRLVSNGPALDRTEICIVDIERARRIPDGRIGEIWICGPTVAKGYWKRSSESDTTFRARLIDGSGPFLRTGDLGAIVDGRLYITGRQKDLVIIRGRNLYPDDIERVVAASNPTVLAGNGVAFSVDGESGERLVIVQEVERTERHRLDGAEVTKEIRARIVEEFGVEPGAVILVRPASVPVTSSGKKQRSACREKYLAGEISALFVWEASEKKALPADSAPMSTSVFGVDEIVAWLRHKLAVTCGREIAEVSITEPFATQGLDSLKLVALSGELATWMARPVDPVEMFDYPSIASLAKHLAGAVAETSASSSVDIAIPPPAGEPIAIIGMACRFPGSDNLSRFRDLLFNGRDAISPLPDGRWPDSEMAVEGGFVSDVDLFDPLFFGITPREAEAMDPQQRLLLLTAWHALEDAGLPPDRLAGTRTGVFVGISTHDYLSAQIARSAALDGHTGTGSAMSVAANRISYLLDLHGPSFVVDTACSSSLVAIHQARNTLRNGECDIAIVAGVNLMLHPDLTEIFKQAGMMAADFRCKSFDASANGYVRGEGCGVVVLCRQSDAVRRRSRIYAELVGSAINQDGRSNGLTAPNGLAQQSVIRDALKSAGVDAAQVGYVETHGTGTPLGDPIEVAALRAVYDREGVTRPLWLGAVKTQIGHLEAAAGIAGLIKTCMVLHQGKIPGNLHLQTINPKINLDGSRLRLPRQVERWDGTDIRYAGVSSFGFGGSNAHVVLRSVNSQVASLQVALPNLFILSAHDERALQDLVQQVVHDWNRSPLNVTELAELCRASQVQRTLLATRLVVICRDPEQAHAALSAYAEGGGHEDLVVGESGVAIPQSPLAFLFTGMGANHVSMGRGLYDAIPTFRIALDRVDAALHPYLNRSIRELFTTSDAEAAIWLEKPHIAQPALFALEYALAHVWIGLLGKPDVVAGHSFGEYTAACIAGLWSVDEAARVIAIRAHLIETLALPGGMVAIRAAPAALEHLISALPDNGLSLAAVNSPEHITVSGEMPSLNKWIEDVAALGGRVTWSESGYAYHSTLLLPMVDEFGSTLEKIRYETPLIPVINHFTGKEAGAEIREPAYWQHHLLEPVHFFDGVQALARMNVGVFVEVGPHPILLNHTRTALPDAIRLASGRREESGISALLNSIAQAVTSGLAVNFSALYGDEPAGAPPTRLLPLYPFARERYWFRADRSRVGLSRRTAHPLLGEKLSLAGSSQTHYQSYLPGGADLGLADHRINGQSVLPATALIDWFLATRNPSWEQSDVWSLTNLSIECMTVLAEETGQFLQTIVSVQEDEVGVELYRRFETEEEWRRVASARWSQVEKGGEHSPPVVQSFADSEPGSNLYQLLRSAGLEYGSTFARVSRFGQQDGSWWAELAPVNPEHKDAWVSDPFTLDAALHIIASAISDKSIMPAAPVELASFRLTGSLSGRLFAVVRRCDPMVDGVIADVVIQDEVGREAAYFGGLRLQRLVPAEAR
ncbi:MAG TPA: beta-ketoacyl synthase N-terminal-like domain-containing protein, partial [Burkholderiales bacterium]|nr:beta-ketoacyl synthase N-terminal-like domain-containing protein [Burkholderiales bacterium]